MKNKYIEKKLLITDKIKISYNLLGFSNTVKNSNEVTFVFVHGLGGDLAAWNEMREMIYEEGFRSLAIDVRGQGLSSRPTKNKDYNIDLLTSDIVKVIEAENLENVVLIGHCFGGMLVQQVAIQNIRQVKRVVLISSSCNPLSFLKNYGVSSKVAKLATTFENYLSKNHKASRINHSNYLGTGDYNLFRLTNDLKNTSLNSYLQIFSQICNFNICNKLSSIKVDVLVIVGNKDKVFPESDSRDICENLPNSKIEILDNADHILIFSHPKKLVDLILESTATMN